MDRISETSPTDPHGDGETHPHADAPARDEHAHAHVNPAGKAGELAMALSMTVGRGGAARTVADLAQLTPGDLVVDLGCGPGTAVRVAASRCAGATGVDPLPIMLRLGRWITALRRTPHVTLVEGKAEAVPLPDGVANVVWALSSVHHWEDRAAGLAEARRLLRPGGRLILAERLVTPRARWHAAHGLSEAAVDDLVEAVARAGFHGVRHLTRQAGHRTLAVVLASAS